MKYLTLKNMERATQMIMDKGYDREEANNMALNCFAMVNQFSNSVEFYIGKILSKAEYEQECGGLINGRTQT